MTLSNYVNSVTISYTRQFLKLRCRSPDYEVLQAAINVSQLSSNQIAIKWLHGVLGTAGILNTGCKPPFVQHCDNFKLLFYLVILICETFLVYFMLCKSTSLASSSLPTFTKIYPVDSQSFEVIRGNKYRREKIFSNFSTLSSQGSNSKSHVNSISAHVNY